MDPREYEEKENMDLYENRRHWSEYPDDNEPQREE